MLVDCVKSLTESVKSLQHHTIEIDKNFSALAKSIQSLIIKNQGKKQ